MTGVKFKLVSLPCGCVVDADGAYVYENEYLACPWCTSVWLFDEAYPWLVEHAGHFARGGFGLFRVDKDVFEFVERCEDCAAPIMRRLADKERIHMEVFLDELERLRN